MPQPGAVSRHPLQELNQARQVQPDSSWEASALLQLPVYRISGVPHGLQPQDYAGAVTSAGDLFPEKKEQKTPLISSLFYIFRVN